MNPRDEDMIADYFDAWIDEQVEAAATAGEEPLHESDATSLSGVFDRALRCAELIFAAWPTDRGTSGARQDSSSTLVYAGQAHPVNSAQLVSRPAQLGRFVIEEEIGRGSFGVVYRAYDPRLLRTVAIKVARPEVAERGDLAKRFLREAAAAAGLDHPGIVPVYEAGESEQLLFFVMPYCEGENLAKWIERQTEPVDERRAADVIRQAAEAVHHGHVHGILHRDIKPANLMLVGDTAAGAENFPEVRVLDFGLSRSLEADLQETRSSMILGTPLYMSPEQARHLGAQVGPATDVFALGAVLYELLTGEAPFVADSLPEIIERLKTCEPQPPRQCRSDVSPQLATICLKCLRLYPADRYASAGELADDLKRFLKGDPIRARRPTWLDRLRWWGRAPRRILDAGVALIVVNVSICMSIFVTSLGPLVDPQGPMAAMRITELLRSQVLLAGVHLVIAWLGGRMLKGSTWALWLGTFAAAMKWMFCFAILFFEAPTLSMYQDFPMAKWLLHAFLELLFTVELLMCLIAIYAQRNTP